MCLRYIIHSCTVISLLILSSVFIDVPQAHAQIPSVLGQSISLESEPSSPGPQTVTKVSLNDYSVNALGASITWYIDGVEQSTLRNERSITFTTKDLGKSTSVRVVLTRENAPSLTHTRVFSPATIHLIQEADSYTPIFYEGKALPSRNTAIRIVALVHDGTNDSQTSYTYKWSENNKVLFGGPMKGKYAIDYTMPQFDNKLLLVEVFNTEGAMIGRASKMLRAVEPEIYFYEENELRGLTERALGDSLRLSQEETTVYGEPYYLNTTIDPSNSDITWSINNTKTTSNTGDNNGITLTSTGVAGTASIEMTILTKATKIPQLVRKTFSAVFSNTL